MVKIKQASLNNALVNLNYCKICSPVDGVVISRAVELGQTVASSFNTPTIFQIANDLTKMQIDSSVAEADVGGVVEGQAVDFTVDAYPDRTFHGVGDAGAQFADDRQQRRHLRLRHQRDERGLQIEAGHDGECLHHRRPARKRADNSQRRAAVPPAGQRRGADQRRWRRRRRTNGNGDRRSSPAGQAPSRRRARARRRTSSIPHGLCAGGRQARIRSCKPVQIKTGISDGISTEVVSGLDEGAQVVTGVVATGAKTTAPSNPFGGGFPRSADYHRPKFPSCKPIPSSSSTTSTRCITPAKWMFMPCAAFRWTFCPANSSPSWVRAAPAKAR